MEQERLWTLLARKLAGEASKEELKELEDLLAETPEHSYGAGILTNWWNITGEAEDAGDGKNVHRLLQRIKQKEEPVLKKYRPGKIKSERSHFINDALMLKSYFKIAWRNLKKGSAFSVTNITGLAIGMASAILILLWIQNELSYDRFHKNTDRLYLVHSRDTYEGIVETWDGSSMLLAPVLEMNYPEVENTARVNPVSAFVIHAGDKHLQSHGYLTDPGFLQLFDFPLVKGDKNTALNSARSIVVTEEFGKKLFGDKDPMGQMVRIDSSINFMVTGVAKDLPNNTRFDFEYLVPWSYMKEVQWDRPYWGVSYIQTYVKLKAGISEAMANTRIKDVVKKNTGDVSYETFLHPASKWRLWSKFENGKITGGYIGTVRLFGAIAGFILLIACINYMNLSTARSVKRAREVGVRKVAGAGRRSLITQFIGESLLIACVAGIIAMIIVQPSLSWFNQLTNKQLTIPYSNFYFWLSFAVFILFTGIMAGSYPAFYLSAYKPIRVLKGTFQAVHALVTPRKVMVVLQFTFAIALIISTFVIHRQIKYGQARDHGFNDNNLAFVFLKGDMRKNYETIRHEMISKGAVTSITRTNSPIIQIWNRDGYDWVGKQKEPGIAFNQFHTDKDFAKTMGLAIVAGRDIDAEKYPSDSTAVLINEAAVKLMGFKDPIGQPLQSQEGNWHVVGVVKDFVPGSPFDAATPTVVQGPGKHHWYGTMSFKMNPQHTTADNLEIIGSILKKYNPDYPFDYYFVDQEYAIKFQDEKRIASLAGIFAGLTIFISCLGLFALAAYMAENRIKEIGVRKVLGASVTRITVLLSKDFLQLVLISFLIASPVAWWAMNTWLHDYPYRITIGWWVFALTGIISTLIACLTVSYQAIKAALANPVKSLRTE